MAAEETTIMAIHDEEDKFDDDTRCELHYCHVMSRLLIESSDDGGDADAEFSDKELASPAVLQGDEDDSEKDSAGGVSLPGTPVLLGMACTEEYASDAEARMRWRRGRGGGRRERLLDRAWEMKKSRAATAKEGECRVLVRRRGRSGCMEMDMEEVRACRDLGLELPDWTVEIPGWLSGSAIDTSSGGSSPVANWCASSPGNDPKDVKARLKAWAHAVALASTSRFSG